MRGVLRHAAVFGLCGAVLCAVGLVKPGLAQNVLTPPSEPLSEQEKMNYGVSCIAETDDPKILIAPSLGAPMVSEIGFDLSFSFIVDGFVYEGKTQYLKGTLINRAGRLVSKGIEFQGPDRNELFVLASQWDCTLYRGLMPWPAHQK